ncbi:MAG: sigma-70 family RNA polymerase sigma factor [Cyclobacteriaceae bacterium]
MLLSSDNWKRFSELSDQEVWNQLRDGNHGALEYLYRTYGKDLYNFGMKLYGKNEWVKDTLHELFVDLWKHHQKLSAVTAVKSYLFKAFRYKLQRQYGKEKHWVYQIDYDNLPETEVELSVESKIISEQFSQQQQVLLYKAIEKLPHRQREVLHLLFDENLSYEETAHMMEINIRSVYTLAWKGISSLKKLLIDPVFSLLLVSASFLRL